MTELTDPKTPERPTVASVTRWRVYTLPRTDDIEFNLTLSTPTDDPRVVEAIEVAAAACGMVIERLVADAN